MTDGAKLYEGVSMKASNVGLKTTVEISAEARKALQCSSEPRDPSMVDQAAELEKWLAELDHELTKLQDTLFGPAGDCECDKPNLSIDGLLSYSSSKAAGLVGYVRTINSRLGQFER